MNFVGPNIIYQMQRKPKWNKKAIFQNLEDLQHQIQSAENTQRLLCNRLARECQALRDQIGTYLFALDPQGPNTLDSNHNRIYFQGSDIGSFTIRPTELRMSFSFYTEQVTSELLSLISRLPAQLKDEQAFGLLTKYWAKQHTYNQLLERLDLDALRAKRQEWDELKNRVAIDEMLEVDHVYEFWSAYLKYDTPEEKEKRKTWRKKRRPELRVRSLKIIDKSDQYVTVAFSNEEKTITMRKKKEFILQFIKENNGTLDKQSCRVAKLQRVLGEEV